MTVTKLQRENGKLKPVSFNYIQAMKLVLDMEAKLAGNQSMIAYAFQLAIKRQRAAFDIILEAKEMIEQNYSCMADIFGNQLTDRIKFFS